MKSFLRSLVRTVRDRPMVLGILAETAFDTLVLKACLHAIEQEAYRLGVAIPFSATTRMRPGFLSIMSLTIG
mgnify:CR=1 FL=1